MLYHYCHGVSTHLFVQKWGVALLFLYFVQCGFGAIIHWKRPAIKIWGILHAVFGLTVIALSFYQVRLGYKYEWPAVTGRDVIKPIENTWIVLIIVSIVRNSPRTRWC